MPRAPWLPGSEWEVALGSWASLWESLGDQAVRAGRGRAGGVEKGYRQALGRNYTYHSFLEMKDPSF